MDCTGPKCSREQPGSKNLGDKTLSNLMISRAEQPEQRIPSSSSSAQRRFTAEEKGKAVLLDSPAADPAHHERFQQAHISGPGGHSVKKAAWSPSPSGGHAVAPQINGEYGGRSGGPRRPQQNLPPTSSLQPQASVFSLIGNGNPFATPSPGPLRALFMERCAAGQCFKCLAPDHKVAECRDQIRCILCLSSGHRATDCRSSAYHHHAGFVLIPGAARQRPEKVRACATFSAAMLTSESHLARHAVIASVAGGNPAVSCRQVADAFSVRFQIAEGDVKVSLYSQAGHYLVEFKDPAHRTEAVRHPLLWVHDSRSALKIRPWTRQSLATAVVKLHYKVRLCIEGVPRHAWQVETVRGLLHPSTLIEGIDHNFFSDKESGCVCIWVWTNDPYCFAKEGVLHIEELPPEMMADDEPCHDPELGFVDQRHRPLRFQSVCLLSYHEVLLHIDKVIDFSPATAASFRPWMYVFNWELRIKDGDLPPLFSPAYFSTLY